MPGLISCGCSSETSRLIIGFSQMARPMPWPICSANAASSSGKPNSVRLRPHRRDFRGRTAGTNQLDRRVEIVAASLVGIDQRVRRRADREAPVVAGAIAHVRVQDVVVHRIARAQHAIREHVRVRAAALARDRVDPLDVLRAQLVEHLARRAPTASFSRMPGFIAVIELVVGRVDHRRRMREQRDLVLRLDLARVGHQLLAVDDR